MEGEVPLIEPVTISMDIVRNLAAGWFTEIPDVEIAGKMEAITVSTQTYLPLEAITASTQTYLPLEG
jgi:hypothetical protein